MKKLGLQEVLDIIGVARWNKDDKGFQEKFTSAINKAIQIEVSDEDYAHILKYYTN